MSVFRRIFAREVRQQPVIDAGALIAAQYSDGYGYNPVSLALNLETDDQTALIQQARRIARRSPHLRSYLRSLELHILPAEPELPEFGERVSGRRAAAVGEMWAGENDFDAEREALHRIAVEGEYLVDGDGALIPADAYTPLMGGPEYAQTVTGYKIGKTRRTENGTLLYVGGRMTGDSRAVAWTACALPYASALADIRVRNAKNLADGSRYPCSIAGATPATGGYAPSRDDLRLRTNDPADDKLIGGGKMPLLWRNEKTERLHVGPDADSRVYEALLEDALAAALNLPKIELLQDFTAGGSFSNLRIGWTAAQAEYSSRRSWFYRKHRLPLFRRWLKEAFADGRLGRGIGRAEMAALNSPRWNGPEIEPPAPEKEAQAALLIAKTEDLKGSE